MNFCVYSLGRGEIESKYLGYTSEGTIILSGKQMTTMKKQKILTTGISQFLQDDLKLCV